MNTSKKQDELQLVGTFESHSDALRMIAEPGQTAVVKRGSLRAVVMSCPCGCGEIVTLNLDKRVGKAWRLYYRRGQMSLYPSVWRDSGCESHFVVWNSKISWLDEFAWLDTPDELTKTQRRVLEKLDAQTYSNFVDIADELGEIPWMVLYTCRDLARAGVAEERAGQETGWFRRRN